MILLKHSVFTMFEHNLPFDPTYGYNLDQLLQVGAPPAPADFEEFWRHTYQEALTVPPAITTRLMESPHPAVELYEIEFDSWNGVRIGGWLTVPVGQEVKHGFVVTHGYGGREAADMELPLQNAVGIFPCLRGQRTRSLLKGVSTIGQRHVLTGIESRETYIHRGNTADVWCAATALLQLFPQVKGSLHYSGGSFGGGIGALALPWDDRFTAGFLRVPSFGNHPLRVTLPCTGSGHSVTNYYQKHPEVLEVLAYHDAATAASFIKIPILAACALFDPSVPPPGQFAVYNALGGPRELIVEPAGHFSYEGEEQTNQVRWEKMVEWSERQV
jgi:cephalosporin-C deacetylase